MPGTDAQTRRFESVASSAMSNATYPAPNDSPTISVDPSGVMTEPFGNARPVAATSTDPSGRTSARSAGANAAPGVSKSKPKLPT